jgi:ornithine cyclodeaminase/alanine dehydrogenase-like protein (mu-crystallin family)
MTRSVRILREADIRGALGMASCIDACADAFAAYSTGGAELPGVIHLDVPEAAGEIHVKVGYIHGAPYYAVKAASGFYALDPPAIDGLVIVFDARDGAPTAFLLDNGHLTDLRTGAAGGVAARYLAPERVRTVAVLGTGGQARQQLDALAVARPGFADVRIWGRNADHADRCVDDVRQRLASAGSPTVTRAAVVEDAVRDADVVITCTAAREPLVRRAWLKSGAHVTAVGSDGVDKQELDPDILEAADLLVVDSVDQCSRLGELQHAPGEAGRAVELGLICADTAPGRTDDAQLTVCDLTGLGVQDVAAANAVMAGAVDGVGDVIEG